MRAESEPTTSFALQRAGLPERMLVAASCGAAAGLLAGMIQLISRPGLIHAEEWPADLYAIGACIALLGAGVALFWISPRAGPPAIEVGRTSIRAPRSIFARRVTRVEVCAIRSVTRAKLFFHWALVIETGVMSGVVVRMASLRSEREVDQLERLLEERIHELPDGQVRLRALRRRQDVARSVWSTRPRLTRITFGVVSVIWLGQLWSGSVWDDHLLQHHGAVAWWLVEAGGWHRLVTASLLHFHLWHFPVNAIGLLTLGRMAELLLGPWRFSIVMMVSGLSMTVYVVLGTGDVAVGLSGAIFGAMGAIVVVMLVRQRELAAPAGLDRRVVLGLLFVLATLELELAQDSAPLHLAGSLAGALAMLAMLPGLDLAKITAPPPRWTRGVAVALGGFYLAAIAVGLHAAIVNDHRWLAP